MRISTIIPAYNRADLIGETLRSVMSQTRPPAEVIVVDDGSSDGTPDIVSEQFGRHVTLLRQANAGAGTARNTGLAHSSGEIVQFQDSDDLSSLNTYAVQAALIEAGADIAYGPWLKASFHGDTLYAEPLAVQQGPLPSVDRLDILLLRVGWVTLLQSCLFRRSLLEKAGPYRTDLAPSEDTELLYRLAKQKPRLAHSAENVLVYRVHPEGQVSTENPEKTLLDRAHLWSLLRAEAEARGDLTWLERVKFNFGVADVARGVAPYSASAAAELKRGLGGVYDRGLSARLFGVRIQAALRARVSSNPYPRVFAAGPLNDTQIGEIRSLGYALRPAAA